EPEDQRRTRAALRTLPGRGRRVRARADGRPAARTHRPRGGPGGPGDDDDPLVPGWRDRAGAQLVTIQAPRSPAAEAYRTLRTSMLVAASERGIKTLMVV